jgi:diguanylate cyclase (GGDEF)-like protein/hemerythrin-like metal-binding protein
MSYENERLVSQSTVNVCSKFKWTADLSVGLSSIDEDHKFLIDTLNQLIACLHNHSSDDVVDDIFITLVDYTKHHFAREEQLMQKISFPDYNNHKKQHSYFLSRLHELQNMLKEKQSNQLVLVETIEFLTQWFLDHIVTFDITLGEYNRKKNSVKLKRKRVFSQVTKVSLPFRLLTLAITPIVALILMTFFMASKNYSDWQNSQTIVQGADFIKTNSFLIHSLQKERGLSTAFIYDKNQYSQEVKKQRAITDDYLENIFSAYAEMPQVLRNKVLIEHNALNERLIELRAKLDLNLISTEVLISHYSQLVSLVIRNQEQTINQFYESALYQDALALKAFWSYKESSGLERARGVMLINEDADVSIAYRQFIQMGESFSIHKKEFITYAPHIFQKLRKKARTNKEHETLLNKISIMREELYIFPNTKKISFDSLEWWNITTQYLNLMHNSELMILNEFIQKSEDQLIQSKDHFFRLLLATLLIILLTVFLSLIFIKSISKPVKNIVRGMNALRSGHFNYKLNARYKGADELSEIKSAYESLRQSMIKAKIMKSAHNQAVNIISVQSNKIIQQSINSDLFKEQANTDFLTQALNRRGFEDALKVLLGNQTEALPIMSFDIDFFKQINDTYGHDQGDLILQRFSSLCRESLRQNDLFSRFGGEEFILVLSDPDLDLAYVIAERLRSNIEHNLGNILANKPIITVSIGLSVYSMHEPIEAAIKRTDKALYISKENGRNQITCLYED